MFAALLCVQLASPPSVEWQSPQFYKHRVFISLTEKFDQPTAARFRSFGSSRDDADAWIFEREFSRLLGGPMGGITIPKTLTITESVHELGPTWRLLGTGPVVPEGE